MFMFLKKNTRLLNMHSKHKNLKIIIIYSKQFCNANYPNLAKKLGQTRNVPIVDNWEEIKDQTMYDVCFARFMQHDN